MSNNIDGQAPSFLIDLLNARSPSGVEGEAQLVVDRYVKDIAADYRSDALGNRFATLNPTGTPSLLLAGHMDELGLQIIHIDKDGYLYFDTVGGHDISVISGRRVVILTENGPVKGITGRRAIHLLNADERKKLPELHNLWIDIGARSRDEARSLVRIGDVAVYDQSFEQIRGSVAVARAFDNKVGAYVVCETLRRLAQMDPGTLAARVVAVATAQEEIGCRGARVAAHATDPDFGIAVDVSHATDHPECDNRRFGETKLGGGPILTRGPNVNPIVFNRLSACAQKEGIAFQVEADPRPTGTDGRELQWSRDGIATGVVGVPLRYMHTPSEMVDLNDIEATVRLLVAFSLSLKAGDHGSW